MLPTVIIDTREQHELPFNNLHIQRGNTLPTIRKKLDVGDYSFVGYEDIIMIERKSVNDLYGTVLGGHERFKRELERAKNHKWKYLVIESTPGALYDYCRMFRDFRKYNQIIKILFKWASEYDLRVRWTGNREDASDLIARIGIYLMEAKNVSRKENQESVLPVAP